MKLDLNLATSPFINRLPQALLLATLAVAALGLTAWNVLTVVRSSSEARAVEDQLSELKAEEEVLRARGAAMSKRLAEVDLKPLQVRATAVNEVLAQKALSWTLLLERLEDILPWKAALQSVQATVGREGVTLTLRVRASGQDGILEFLDALESSPCFSNAYPGDELRLPSGEFETSVEVATDPYCGNAPEVPGARARGSVTRRGGRRG